MTIFTAAVAGDEIEVGVILEPEANIFEVCLTVTDGLTGEDITIYLPWKDARALSETVLELTFDAEDAESAHLDIPVHEVKVVSMAEVRELKRQHLNHGADRLN